MRAYLKASKTLAWVWCSRVSTFWRALTNVLPPLPPLRLQPNIAALYIAAALRASN
ncbi:hypothetical protein J6590_002121 [Homalodisca vitripennis]|nr:hypothetical protein J6590_002121 [Homalodisca vitripennis]